MWPRPQIKPSRLESDTPPSQQEGSPKEGSAKRPGSEKRPKNSQLTIHHRVPLHIDDLPPGAVLKGYEPYVVQDLVIESKNTLYLRARYELPTRTGAPMTGYSLGGSVRYWQN